MRNGPPQASVSQSLLHTPKILTNKLFRRRVIIDIHFSDYNARFGQISTLKELVGQK